MPKKGEQGGAKTPQGTGSKRKRPTAADGGEVRESYGGGGPTGAGYEGGVETTAASGPDATPPRKRSSRRAGRRES